MAIDSAEEELLTWLPFLLQTGDALFPTGGYAHSLGFEEMVRLWVVHDEASLVCFLLEQIAPALQQQELPYLRLALEAPDLNALCQLDREIGAWKLPNELRTASLQFGSRRLRALQNISADPALGAFAAAVSAGRAAGHHLVVCALQARVAKAPLPAALGAYYYQSVAAICAASLKLIRIGQEGVQRALHAALQGAHDVVKASLTVAHGDAGCFNPLLEIASMRHERAEERLFIS